MRSAVLTLAVAAALSLGAAATPHAGAAAAADKATCSKRSEIVAALMEKFGETQQSFGLQSDAKVLEVFASTSGSWTALVTMPNGKSCIVASGQAWSDGPLVVMGRPV